MRRYLLLINAVLLLCAGCGKDKTLPTVDPALYTNDGSFEEHAITMYVKGGAITDAAFIQAYLERINFSSVFNMPGAEHLPVLVSFDSRNEDSIRLSVTEGVQTRISQQYNKVLYDNSTALFITSDTLSLMPADDGEISCSNMQVRLRKHAPQPDCSVNPLGLITCAAREQLPVEMVGDKLRISIMHMSYSRYKNLRSCLVYQRFVLDQLDKTPLMQMHENDTLVLQTSTVLLERK